MPRYTIVVDRAADWRWGEDGFQVLTAEEFLTHPRPRSASPQRVINLCRGYKYLSAGYFCSIFAEARGEWPMPTVGCILDLSSKALYGPALPDLERLLNQIAGRLASPPAEGFVLHVFFGRADDPRFRRLAAAAFDLFRYPLMRMRLAKGKAWRIDWIRPIGLDGVAGRLARFFEDALRFFTRTPPRRKAAKRPALYDLAVLVNPADRTPPSDRDALERFRRAGPPLRMDVELIGPKDLGRLAQFDALFIRETTALPHHTFRFARKAAMEGMPVIDDPETILRCTNKVYMAELLAAGQVPTPRTLAVDRDAFRRGGHQRLERELGYPVVLKVPDGCFSQGVVKAENRLQLVDLADRLFQRSRVILAQEYMYTAFDWRVGVLGGKPLYCCQYRMSRNHWQVVKHRGDGSMGEGGHRTFAVEQAPAAVVETAVRAAALVGDGLYGVDLKENGHGVFVIEVNDNPNLEHGVEDLVLKGDLYRLILEEFVRRIEQSRTG
jgi:glutathione synthase/RimK-type ligase-like ATP-grasp enzyme